MADSAIVAVVQAQWKRQETGPALVDYLARFLRLARNKGAELVLLPELSGVLVAGPMANEKRDALRKKGSLFDRMLHPFAAAPTFQETLPLLINEHSPELIERYVQLFGGLAREYHVTLVGGSLIARDDEGIAQYRAGVFNPEGTLLGWQAKLHLTEQEATLASAGDSLTTFEAPFGRFGILIGSDILFPELARALAYRGCVGILNPTLAASRDAWHRQRIVANARAQENQIFVGQSFLIGEVEVLADPSSALVGKSCLLAPVELSPRGDGMLGEVGAEVAEGVVSNDWNVAALRNLWQSTELPVREMLRGTLFHELLTFDYESGSTIAERTTDVEIVAELPDEQYLAEQAELPDGLLALPIPGAEEATLAAEQQLSLSPPLPDTTGAAATPIQPPMVVPAPVEPMRHSESPPEGTGSRSIPMIDPETGRYLGEKPVEEG